MNPVRYSRVNNIFFRQNRRFCDANEPKLTLNFVLLCEKNSSMATPRDCSVCSINAPHADASLLWRRIVEDERAMTTNHALHCPRGLPQ